MISKWEEEQERIAHRNAKQIIHPTMVHTGTGMYDLEFNGGSIQLSRDEAGNWTFWAVILDSPDYIDQYGSISFGQSQHVSCFANDSLEKVRKALDGED